MSWGAKPGWAPWEPSPSWDDPPRLPGVEPFESGDVVTPAGLDELRETTVIAVLRAPDAEAAAAGVDALVRGGIKGIEITYSTPDAAAVIAEVTRRHGEAVLVGAGTVTAPGQAAEAAAAGARFLVSPGTRPALAAEMRETGATVMLGALTPSEVMLAVELGADVVKVFPASLGGPAYLKSLRGPFPDVPLMPTGGVSADNIGQWLAAGAVAVGAGGELCSGADLAAGAYDTIERKARTFMAGVGR
ncbi:MAG: bifunctional 4-hydroxy-2-oxoglutarate aldolase/2-dehydro-3-deoxy-phosphogluconate aldolase [Streptosporangiales bacterium]|nr:bifunctional 4-hydroxy-2-oxoglutarate aldolase/2-dehydro-3-deoxy-phosphogluconate aldolase [Streptosporangiales bacterium]